MLVGYTLYVKFLVKEFTGKDKNAGLVSLGGGGPTVAPVPQREREAREFTRCMG
jgi:hypothetical protein